MNKEFPQLPLSDGRGGGGGGRIGKLLLLSIFFFDTFIPQTFNLSVIQIVAMIKRICLLLTWAGRFYCHLSVSKGGFPLSRNFYVRTDVNFNWLYVCK